MAVIGPVAAPAGTLAANSVAELMVKTALVPLNFTSVTKSRAAPVIVIESPVTPLAGLIEVITGGLGVMPGKKGVALTADPPGVITLIGPASAGVGTMAEFCVAESAIKLALPPL